MSTETAHTETEAEEARRSHSIMSGVREAIAVWYALLGGIAAWTIHLVFFAAFVKFTCNAAGTTWAMHLVTVVTLAMTAFAMFLCWRMLKSQANADEAADDEGGRAQFIARMGLLIEEIYLIVLNSRRCG